VVRAGLTERVLPVVWFQPHQENRRGNKPSFTLLQAEQWAFKVAMQVDIENFFLMLMQKRICYMEMLLHIK